MKQITENKTISSIKNKFNHIFQWNLWGSIIYQIFRITHHFFLIQFLSTELYGLSGSIFCSVYLLAKFADVGATYSLAPFFCLLTRSRQQCKKIITKYYLLPHIPILAIALVASFFFYQKSFNSNSASIPIVIFLALISIETVRAFLRYILHFSFETKYIILLEVSGFAACIISVWSYIFIFGKPTTLNVIFIPILIESAFVVIMFAKKAFTLYQSLPDWSGRDQSVPENEQKIPATLNKQMVSSRSFNYLLRVSRDFFTSNFLTPLFAFKFGLKNAGLFFFAGITVTAIQTIFKITIGYSGKAYLANLKEHALEVKREAFNTLCTKLTKFVIPIIALILLNYKSLMNVSHNQNQIDATLTLALLFLVITCLEFLFIIYEQFYIIEEQAGKLFYYKLIEFAFFYIFVLGNNFQTPVATLLSIIALRSISFIIVALQAYFVWGIKPSLKLNIPYVGSCALISLLISFLT